MMLYSSLRSFPVGVLWKENNYKYILVLIELLDFGSKLSKINKWTKQLVLNWYQSKGWILTNAWGLLFDYNVEKFPPHRTQSKNCWTELLGRSQILLDFKALINPNFIRNLLYKLAQSLIYHINSIQHFETSRGYFFIFFSALILYSRSR